VLSTTQFLIFEIGCKCNLGHVHGKCPNSIRTPTSTRTLTDDLILKCIDEAYTQHSFTGLVGWHYYNEPMLEHERIFSLMERYPRGRYVLWTNGTIQPDDSRMGLFEQVYCTDYTGINRSYYSRCKNVSIISPVFDNRIKDVKRMSEDGGLCWRQHTESILDNWGVSHLCCQDWRADIEIGSIWHSTFGMLLRRRREILRQMSKGEYPERCRKCNGKIKRLAKFDKIIRERTLTK
jgi:hypothetical protein